MSLLIDRGGVSAGGSQPRDCNSEMSARSNSQTSEPFSTRRNSCTGGMSTREQLSMK